MPVPIFNPIFQSPILIFNHKHQSQTLISIPKHDPYLQSLTSIFHSQTISSAFTISPAKLGGMLTQHFWIHILVFVIRAKFSLQGFLRSGPSNRSCSCMFKDSPKVIVQESFIPIFLTKVSCLTFIYSFVFTHICLYSNILMACLIW